MLKHNWIANRGGPETIVLCLFAMSLSFETYAVGILPSYKKSNLILLVLLPNREI